MRLIDADALEYHEIDEIGGEYEPYLGCSKEYIDRQPTVDVLEQIRAEIQKVLDAERDFTSENAKAQAIALSWCLEIIDKYKGDKE